MSTRTDVFYEGKVHVMTKQCSTCIFRRDGGALKLSPGRRDELVSKAVAIDGHIPCHSTLHLSEGAVCRGFFDRHAGATLQIADRLGFIEGFKL